MSFICSKNFVSDPQPVHRVVPNLSRCGSNCSFKEILHGGIVVREPGRVEGALDKSLAVSSPRILQLSTYCARTSTKPQPGQLLMAHSPTAKGCCRLYVGDPPCVTAKGDMDDGPEVLIRGPPPQVFRRLQPQMGLLLTIIQFPPTRPIKRRPVPRCHRKLWPHSPFCSAEIHGAGLRSHHHWTQSLQASPKLRSLWQR